MRANRSLIWFGLGDLREFEYAYRMPELPEVECVRQGILAEFLGQKIVQVWSRDTGNLLDQKSLSLQKMKSAVLHSVERRGKYLRWITSDFQLIAHLGMTGVWSANAERQKHTRVEFRFENGTWLSYTDPRQFGYLCVIPSSESHARWMALGPDAIGTEWSGVHLWKETRSSRVEIKVFLMDQNHVAGIGNIYASEALFAARVHPQRCAQSLTRAECNSIVRHTKKIMMLSIHNRGTTFSDYRLTNGKGGAFQGFLKVFQKPGKPCPRCRNPISQIVQGGRSTFFCEECQGGK